MVYLPIVSIILSFAIVYAMFGWSFSSFWDVVLFAIMLTINALQFGKMLCAAMSTYQGVAGLYSVYMYLGVIVSGFFVNPRKIPDSLRWIMYLSLSFWAISGAELTHIANVPIGEGQCLTIISCIMLNQSTFAQYLGFTAVTTAQLSMLALFIGLLLLVLIEYCFLLQKVQQRGNFEKVEGLCSHRASCNSVINRTCSSEPNYMKQQSDEASIVFQAVDRGSANSLDDVNAIIDDYRRSQGSSNRRDTALTTSCSSILEEDNTVQDPKVEGKTKILKY